VGQGLRGFGWEGGGCRSVLFLAAVDIQIVFGIVLVQGLQPHHDLAVVLTVFWLDTDVMCGEGDTAFLPKLQLGSFEEIVHCPEGTVAFLCLNVEDGGQEGRVADHADVEGQSVVVYLSGLVVEIGEVAGEGGVGGLLCELTGMDLASLADERWRAVAVVDG